MLCTHRSEMPCKEEGSIYSSVKNAIIGTSSMHVANTWVLYLGLKLMSQLVFQTLNRILSDLHQKWQRTLEIKWTEHSLKLLNADTLRHRWNRWKLWWNRNRKPSKFVLLIPFCALSETKIHGSDISISSQTDTKVYPYKLRWYL